jgi:hypothetical protein
MTHRGAAQTYLQRHFVSNNDRKAWDMATRIPKYGAFWTFWARECKIFISKARKWLTMSLDNLSNTSWHALSGQWPFGKSKLDLKQSSLRRVRSSNLKLASWRAELVTLKLSSKILPVKNERFRPIIIVGECGVSPTTGWTRFKQEQRRGYQLWATSSCTSGTE